MRDEREHGSFSAGTIQPFERCLVAHLAATSGELKPTHQEKIEMAYVTGEVISSDDEEFPFKVVFKRGEEVVSEWLVDSQKTGEDQIIQVLQAAAEEDEEDEDDDEDEDQDEDDDESDDKKA